MKKILAVSLLGFATAFNSFPAPTNQPPTSAEQLRSEVELAFKAKDATAVMSLYNWNGVTPDAKASRLNMVTKMLKHDVTSVKLSSLPPGFQATTEWGEIRYSLNIPVVGIIDVQFEENSNSLKIPYGKMGKTYYLPGVIEKRLQKYLSVSVIGVSSLELVTPAGDVICPLPKRLQAISKPVTVDGSLVYMLDDKEITENLSRSVEGECVRIIVGEYIKSCTIKRTSDEGWIKLVISESGKTIFDSGLIENNAPIAYERRQP